MLWAVMVAFSQKKMASLTLLSIVLPISLLASFRMTGILKEPIGETFQKYPVVWSHERPSTSVNIQEKIRTAHQNDQLSVELGIYIVDYCENNPWRPFDYKDGMRIKATINIAGIRRSSASFIVRFYQIDANSAVYVDRPSLIAYNASVLDIEAFGSSGSEAIVASKASDSSSDTTFESYWIWRVREDWMLSSNSLSGLDIQAYWVFNEANLEDHQLMVSLEVTYPDGAAYSKIILPALLEIGE